MMNPTLADLVGGIQSVTLGDEEARRRGTQKSILERKSPPTFDIVVEIQERDRVAIHPDVGEAVDTLLREATAPTEVRWLNENGEIMVEKAAPAAMARPAAARVSKRAKEGKPNRVYLYGVNKSRLQQMGRDLNVNVDVVDNLRDANMLVTSKHYYRRRPQKVKDAESARLPVYVLRSNTPPQMKQFLGTLAPPEEVKEVKFKDALDEAEEAVAKVQGGQEEVELSPQSAYIRRLQHIIAQRSDLASHSSGRDPNRRVRIFKERRR